MRPKMLGRLLGATAIVTVLASPALAQNTGPTATAPAQQDQPPAAAGPAPSSPASAGAPAPTATPATQPGAISEIVVTGSRIRGVAPVGSTVIGVNHDDISATGAVNITDALQDVPQILNLGVSEDSRGTSGGAGNITYASGINIRGIGPYATLTLLDGRRMVQAGASGGLPDPSDIPVIGLERAEIVPDGASAIYGSDAVAGVANLILKRNFEGIEAMARDGTANSYNESQIDIIAGHTWDSGQFTAAFERSYHSALNGENRDFYRADLTARGGSNFSSPNCSNANIVVDGVSYAGPGYAANTTNLCDNLKNQDLIPQQERLNFDFTFNQNLGQYVSFYAEGLASERNFVFHSGTQNSALTVPSTNAYYRLPAGVTAASETVETNFDGQAPVNSSSGGDKMFQVTSGFDVHLPHNFKFETDYTYGQDTAKSVSYNGLNNGALATALASSNPATALNPYGANSTAVLQSVFNSYSLAPGNNIQQEVEAKIDGPIFTLPGGDVRVAFGGEYDNTSLYTGFASGALPDVFSTRVSGKQEVKAAYGELFIPIVGIDNAIPLVQSLAIDVAGRYEDYTDLGSTTNPKVGVNWSPIHGLTIHGSYGTSFRAPSPSSIHGALSALFVQPYATPNGSVVEGVALSGYTTGNPLTPETAKTYSIGADYQPDFYRNLKISINYFNIDYEKQITSYLADLTLLSSAERQALFSSIIRTGPAAQAIVNQFVSEGYQVFGALPQPVNYFIYGQNFNLGSTKADGFDFSVNAKFPTEKFGTFGAGLNGTYFLDYLVAVTPNAPELSEANRIFNPLRLRMRGNVNWNGGPVSVTAFVNFENSYINDTVTPVQRVDSYTTVDLHTAFAVDKVFTSPYLKHTSIMVDVTNLFDTDPPFVNIAESTNGGGGFDPTVANPFGRLVSVAIDKKF